jgi:HEAT repeat protein
MLLLPAGGQEPAPGTKDRQGLVQKLTSKDPEERSSAALGLRLLKSAAKEAVPALLKVVTDEDRRVRIDAVATLGLTRSDAPEVLAALARALEDRVGRVRPTAITALVHIGKKSIPVLQKGLKHKDPAVRVLCAYGLWKLQAPAQTLTPVLRVGLTDKDRLVRGFSAYALGNMKAKEAVPDLIQALKDSDRPVVDDAVRALRKLGPQAVDAAPGLCQLWKQVAGPGRGPSNYDTRHYVIAALSALGPEARPEVAKLLKHPKAEVRMTAAGVLAVLGGDIADVLPLLLRGLQDKDSLAQSAAAEALEKIGPRAKEAVPALAKNLKGRYANVRVTAAKALAAMGSEAKQALPALKAALLGDYPVAPESMTDRAVTEVLVKIGKPALPTLSSILEGKKLPASVYAAAAKGRIEGNWKEPLRVLHEGLKDPRSNMDALQMLEQIGPQAKEAVPEVIKALRTESFASVVRRQAAQTLGKIAPGNKEAAQALRPYLEDREASVRNRVAFSLWLLTRNARDTVPVLVRVFQDPKVDFFYRREAVQLLGQMAPDANAAVPVLLRALDDAESGLRGDAGDALKQIDPEAARVGIL